MRIILCNKFGIQVGSLDGRYIGMHIAASHSTCRLFQYLVDRVWNKLWGWKEKFLSQAGKEILIKTVVQALPAYTMQCFFTS